MHIIKCRSFADVPLSSTQSLIYEVTNGRIAADITVKGVMTRVEFSGFIKVESLPEIDDTVITNALYASDGKLHYATASGWNTLATVADVSGVLNDVAAQLVAKADAKDLDNLVTLVDELSDNVDLKASSDDLAALTTRVSTTESSIVDLAKADNELDERVTALESNGATPDEGASVDLTEVWEAVNTKVDAEYVAEAIKDKANLSEIQELSTLIHDTENGLPAIKAGLSSVESGLGDKADKSELFSGYYIDLQGKPELFSGSYNDLTDTPTIPSIDGLATENSVAELSATVVALSNRVTDLELAGPSEGASNPALENLSGRVTELETTTANNVENIAANSAAIAALQELLAGAAGSTFGVITNDGMFQALDLTGSTPATIGDPVDCDIYTFKTPAS